MEYSKELLADAERLIEGAPISVNALAASMALAQELATSIRPFDTHLGEVDGEERGFIDHELYRDLEKLKSARELITSLSLRRTSPPRLDLVALIDDEIRFRSSNNGPVAEPIPPRELRDDKRGRPRGMKRLTREIFKGLLPQVSRTNAYKLTAAILNWLQVEPKKVTPETVRNRCR